MSEFFLVICQIIHSAFMAAFILIYFIDRHDDKKDKKGR